jgi:hypothetical protein
VEELQFRCQIRVLPDTGFLLDAITPRFPAIETGQAPGFISTHLSNAALNSSASLYLRLKLLRCKK